MGWLHRHVLSIREADVDELFVEGGKLKRYGAAL
jgi:hypothetical protein